AESAAPNARRWRGSGLSGMPHACSMNEATEGATGDGAMHFLRRAIRRRIGHWPWAGDASDRAADLAPISYQPFDRLTIQTTDSITGTSMSTPTTVASAAPELKPNRLMAAATANSKKLLAPISAEGPATQCCSPIKRFRR